MPFEFNILSSFLSFNSRYKNLIVIKNIKGNISKLEMVH